MNHDSADNDKAQFKKKRICSWLKDVQSDNTDADFDNDDGFLVPIKRSRRSTITYPISNDDEDVEIILKNGKTQKILR